MSTKEQRNEWRKLKGQGMTSAIGEYTPSEFWALLNEIDSLENQRGKLAYALFEVVDAAASLDKPWDLEGYGIPSKRAEEICDLAALGRPS